MTSQGSTASPEDGSISELLRQLAERDVETLSVDEVVDHFGHRAFGALLFIFALPNLLPLPPGSTTVLGLPLVIIAPQLLLGMETLWLPKAVGRRRIRRTDLKRTFDRARPWLRRIERLSRPRLGWVYGGIGDRLAGLVCTLLAVVLILPIPFGNILPSLTIAALSLGLTQRDGGLGMIGYGLAAAAAGVLVLTFHAAVAAAKHLVHALGA